MIPLNMLTHFTGQVEWLNERMVEWMNESSGLG
jgi:hypothetical protein